MGRQKRLVEIFGGSRCLLVIEGVEVLERLVFVLLMLPLQRLSFGNIKDVHEVSTIHFDPLILAVLLVERFLKTLVVRVDKPPVMHDFNGRFGEVHASSPWAIYHDGHLFVTAGLHISGGDSLSDWEVVGGDVAGFDGHEIQMSLLHFQTVRIGPECFISIKAVIQPPVDGDILALIISHYGYSVEFNVKLDQS